MCLLALTEFNSKQKKIDFFFIVRLILPIHAAPSIMRFSELWVFPFFHPSPPSSSSSSQCFVYFLLFSNRRDVFALSAQSHNHIWKRENASKNCCYICGIVDWSFWLVNAFVFHSKWTRLYVPTRSFSAWFFLLACADEFSSQEKILKLSSLQPSHPRKIDNFMNFSPFTLTQTPHPRAQHNDFLHPFLPQSLRHPQDTRQCYKRWKLWLRKYWFRDVDWDARRA